MNANNTSMATALNEMHSVIGEIKRLRVAVDDHRKEAIGLQEIGSALSALTEGLARLPADVQQQFSGIQQLSSSLDIALRPAGTVQASLEELTSETSSLLHRVSSIQDHFHSGLQGVRDDMTALKGYVREMQGQVSGNASSREVTDVARAISSLTVVMRNMGEDVKRTSLLAEDSAKRLARLSQRYNIDSVKQLKDTQEIKSGLAKLTGLARRKLLAMLTGKDAPSEPL